MLLDATELLFIPILMNEVPLKWISDDEAVKIASAVRKLLPPMPEAKVVIIPVLYYLSDIFSRMTLDEILVNSTALVDHMEKRGIKSSIYIFNPYSSNGMIPLPSRLSGSISGSAWAVIPVIILGGYMNSAEYESDEDDDFEYALRELESLISAVYGVRGLKAFPPLSIEGLIDLIDYIESAYEGEGLNTSAG